MVFWFCSKLAEFVTRFLEKTPCNASEILHVAPADIWSTTAHSRRDYADLVLQWNIPKVRWSYRTQEIRQRAKRAGGTLRQSAWTTVAQRPPTQKNITFVFACFHRDGYNEKTTPEEGGVYENGPTYPRIWTYPPSSTPSQFNFKKINHIVKSFSALRAEEYY